GRRAWGGPGPAGGSTSRLLPSACSLRRRCIATGGAHAACSAPSCTTPPTCDASSASTASPLHPPRAEIQRETFPRLPHYRHRLDGPSAVIILGTGACGRPP